MSAEGIAGKAVPCKGAECKKKILHATTEDGKRIPLDSSAPVYLCYMLPNGDLRAERANDCYVTHFATCPSVVAFAKKKKEQPK